MEIETTERARLTEGDVQICKRLKCSHIYYGTFCKLLCYAVTRTDTGTSKSRPPGSKPGLLCRKSKYLP